MSLILNKWSDCGWTGTNPQSEQRAPSIVEINHALMVDPKGRKIGGQICRVLYAHIDPDGAASSGCNIYGTPEDWEALRPAREVHAKPVRGSVSP